MSGICYLSSVIVCSNTQGRPDGTLPQVSRHQDNVVIVLLNSSAGPATFNVRRQGPHPVYSEFASFVSVTVHGDESQSGTLT